MITIEQLKRFVGRTNPYAIQFKNGAYIPVHKQITEELLQDHLDGKKTMGTYVIKENGMVNYGAIDIDCDPKFVEKIKPFAEMVYSFFKDFERVLEKSGRRGYHVWVFFKQEEKPKFVLELIKSRLLSHCVTNVEIFPKQTKTSHLKKGLGNLIKLPFGLHQITGKRSELLKWDK